MTTYFYGIYAGTAQNCVVYGLSAFDGNGRSSCYGVYTYSGGVYNTASGSHFAPDSYADFISEIGDYNASSDGSAPGTHSLTYVNLYNQFESAWNDWHIKSTSVLRNAGTSLSGFNWDVDGDTRPQGSAWDIGIDEYLEAAPPSFKPYWTIGLNTHIGVS